MGRGPGLPSPRGRREGQSGASFSPTAQELALRKADPQSALRTHSQFRSATSCRFTARNLDTPVSVSLPLQPAGLNDSPRHPRLPQTHAVFIIHVNSETTHLTLHDTALNLRRAREPAVSNMCVR